MKNLKEFFATGKTKSLDFRIQQLKILHEALSDNKEQILAALKEDLGRAEFESYFGELQGVLHEIKYAIKNLKKWSKPKKVSGSLLNFPSSNFIQKEPLGVVLIIAPWNFPFLCSLSPLVGAIAAGNCVVMKPSELAPTCSKVLAEILSKSFDSDYILAREGGVEVSQELLAEHFDHIFFTGGTEIGKIVMSAAAKNLTPVVLELGGKSPCIVDADVNLEQAVKRIAWGKFFNTGQCCVAPDYLLIHQSIKDQFIEMLYMVMGKFYGNDPKKSADFGRIVNKRHFDRIKNLIENTRTHTRDNGSSGTKANVIIGGDYDETELYIAPTVIDDVEPNDPVMKEEIFGPVLPMMEYGSLDCAIDYVNKNPKPLALYFFSEDYEKQEMILNSCSSGGVTINDTLVHTSSSELPFGGVGTSGMGKYHGEYSFNVFSNDKAVVRKSFGFDPGLKFPPYAEKFKKLKNLFSLI